MFDKILLPTDGSDISMAAAERAIALAKLVGAPLHVVFVHEPYPYASVGATDSASLNEYLAAAQQHAAAAFARVEAAAHGTGVRLGTELVEGRSPAEKIVEAAGRHRADLIVMGSHGRTGLARVLLGSVTGKVLVLSPVPVMVVK